MCAVMAVPEQHLKLCLYYVLRLLCCPLVAAQLKVKGSFKETDLSERVCGKALKQWS